MLDKKITDVIENHHVLTLATSFNDDPHCCNVFYVYLPDENLFVFASDPKTKHISQITHNMVGAGSIFLETENISKIEGLQLQGLIYRPTESLSSKTKTAYYKRFPLLIFKPPTLWVYEPTYIKLTHYTLGIGKKIVWKSLTGLENLKTQHLI